MRSSAVPRPGRPYHRSPASGEVEHRTSTDVSADQVLTQLDDDVNRRFLSLTSGTWHTAQELAKLTDTPLSTTYRKLGTLEEIGLVDQRLRVRPNGKHPEEYRAVPLLVSFTIGEETGLRVDVRHDETVTN